MLWSAWSGLDQTDFFLVQPLDCPESGEIFFSCRLPGKKTSFQYHLCLLLRVRVGGYIVNLLDFYSYRLIGKLTAFLQLQEFSQRNQPVDSFTFAARLSFNSSKVKLVWLSLK